ncbi:transglycosylase domain-containing protein [Microcystis aeruginosa]|uniref:Penicillin-binding protein 1A n=1 Tax=Microcystis aeruginosa 11-30S32 TaxID=2358142 RepID=A0A510PM85_MICAE|nr:penicillin-binding protein 1A [Microcystis aeruginosa]GCA94944.1 penicillin-binding protein 1A [Microcystis aeruginosa 11-30S32]
MSTSTLGNQDKEQKPSSDSDSFFQGVSRVAGGTVLGLLMVSTAVVTGAVVGLAISYRNLPDVRILRGYVPTETSYIYDVKGRPLTSLHGEANREVVELDQISPNLKRAVMAIEDSHFYHHRGINPNSIGRAVVANWKSGGVVEGASTITMQLVKNIFLSHQRTVSRKLAEAVLAVRVEQVFSKNDILEMYLNNIYWGHNNYGVQTAAKSYFNKPASELNLAESAMMAGLIQAPEVYSPFNNYKTAKERQALVLSRMRTLGWITLAQEEAALKEPLKLGKPTAWQESKLPYVTDAVVAELRQKFGKETLTKGGMRIQTTIDLDFQNMAESTIQRAYNSLRGRGIRTKDLQISLVAVDPRTHFVKALVGGVDYNKSQLNRAIQSRRQPGSAFKPFVYYTAFASGRFTPETVINDAPVRFREAGGFYSPKNYGGGFSGPVSLRSALMQSLNIPAVVLGRRVGINKVIEVCRLLGFESPLIAVTSLPLGSVDVTPLEMAGAYATFASNGWHSKPTFIMRVTDSRGNVMLDNTPKPKLVLDPWATASLNSVLQGVIQGGTATSAQIGRPAAGKTGTTDNEKNVWFVGYVPQLATAVWIGDDRNRTLGKGITGGGFAAPIWRDFMAQALKNERVEYFPSPSKFRKPTVK